MIARRKGALSSISQMAMDSEGMRGSTMVCLGGGRQFPAKAPTPPAAGGGLDPQFATQGARPLPLAGQAMTRGLGIRIEARAVVRDLHQEFTARIREPNGYVVRRSVTADVVQRFLEDQQNLPFPFQRKRPRERV